MLARKIAYLASLWKRRITRRGLSANEGIKMAERSRAVAIFRDRSRVDVVKEWTTAGWKIVEADAEGYSDAIWVRRGRDRTFDITTRILRVEEFRGGQSSSVDDARRIVFNDCSIAQSARNWLGGGLSANEYEESSHKDRTEGG